MIVDSYGRDLDWLERHAPKVKPPRWMFWMAVLWPVQAVELWHSAEQLRGHA